ncbi:DUF6507 family protein [Cellulomonas fimi]|uniref:Uncharacterized protein n=1 Tax=Cellulomonas fimi TaxID=1708 RepID=A0A7Y0M0I3_CELFI|nr:DUF6507 family protein [Cellulomonas fimi]NMR20212.1 hypothetical protein [Cellulomonas fimi]
MTSWSISPAEVRAVLEHVRLEAAGLDDTVRGIDTAIAGALDACADSPVIGEALAIFVENRAVELRLVDARIDDAVAGALTATVAYERGDEQMAAEQQAMAASVALGGRLESVARNGA